jgi:small-conductance mechanosensitive channel
MHVLDPTTWPGTVVILAIVLLATTAAIQIIRLVLVRLAGRAPRVADFVRRVHAPALTVALVVALWITGAVTLPGSSPWWSGVSHLFLVVAVLAGAWLLGTLASVGFEHLIARDRGGTDAEARSRRTQLVVIHRLSLVLIGVLALGVVLFSFPEMRVIGTSLLASAGIVSIVAGLAAQSLLGNLIAGIQIAFTEAIKVDDIVVVNEEWGRIGEINLAYVVVYIWDERRLVLPCTYFTTQPFETWTRTNDNILGTVYMDLDWRVPMEAVRARFQQIMDSSEEWDRRSSSVYVTDSQGGYVTVRFVMSARNSDDQWILRCRVREQMMTWLQNEHPEALPTTRILTARTHDAG